MTPQEIQAAVKALRDEIGGKCQMDVRIDGCGERPCQAVCWPLGLVGDDVPYLRARSMDWLGAINGIRTQWADISEDVRHETTRKMALAIIRITAGTGECSDAALRADRFTNSDIEMYGGDACEAADDMASNGPFRITAVQGANAA